MGVSVVCPELIHTRIGDSQRNRPEHLERDAPTHAEQTLVEEAIRERSSQSGLDPKVIAERTLEAIREGRLYVLPPEGDAWRDGCNARLDDLLHARNPGGAVPGEG